MNNAGVGHTGPLPSRSRSARVEGMLDLNARAPWSLTRLFLPAMVERGRGAVVNVVSTSAFQPVPFLAVYAASKAFLLSLTEALADRARRAPACVVQALCPGLTATEFQERRRHRPRAVQPHRLDDAGGRRRRSRCARWSGAGCGWCPGWPTALTAALVPLHAAAGSSAGSARELFRPARSGP